MQNFPFPDVDMAMKLSSMKIVCSNSLVSLTDPHSAHRVVRAIHKRPEKTHQEAFAPTVDLAILNGAMFIVSSRVAATTYAVTARLDNVLIANSRIGG